MELTELAREKRILRREIREKLAKFPPLYLQSAGREISVRLAALPAYQRAGTVFAFASTDREPDLSVFLRRVLADGKRLALPVCIGPGIMEARVVSTLEGLTANALGLLEPSAACPTTAPEEIDLLVVPCMACDRQGNRLGHGGGYYDRYLARCAGEAVLVCPEALVLGEIPMGPLDCPISTVVTEKETLFPDGSRTARPPASSCSGTEPATR